MKKLFLLATCLFAMALQMNADGGMWLMKLAERQHLADSLKKAGLQMSLSEVYSDGSGSLRDCIGIFGNGCTGEIVSDQGLVFTNNHCGFSYVHDMSTMEHNYLQDGFFAHSQKEELECPFLTFTFVKQVENVTDLVMAEAAKKKVDIYTAQSKNFLDPIAEKWLKKAKAYKKQKGISAEITPFFDGNEFYLFVYQQYSDVRLVVNPPQNIAQFGFNQDNWIWPRHNADFAVFRIYADAEGQPADYSETNVPLATPRFLPISTEGPQEGDYTMIMGFPGTTTRYLTASEVELRCDALNRAYDTVGNVQLNYMKSLMDADPELNLKLADSYMSLGNVCKNFGGMNESVRRRHLVEQKREEEKEFRAWANMQIDNPEYALIIERIDSAVTSAKDSIFDFYLSNIMSRAKNPSYTKEQNRELLGILMPMWQKLHRVQMPMDTLFTMARVQEDSLTVYADFATRKRILYPALNANDSCLARLNNIYTRALLEKNDYTTSPDANFTQRLTYGHVIGMTPRDGVTYDWKTILEGMFEKENPADPDYVINEQLRALHTARNYGRWARPDGKLQVCFLTDNDITGGNSGSAVLNAKGELIGLAFDGNIESLSSDLRFDPVLQRCINVDVRYVLFICDTFGGSSYLLKEMKIK